MFRQSLKLLGICLLLSTNLMAQKGLKLGPQLNFLSSRPYVIDSLPNNFNFRFKSGFRAGLTMQYGFSEGLVLASGLFYTNKGYRLYNDTNTRGNVIKHNSGLFELPVNLHLKLRVGASSKMRFVVGGSINYNLQSTTHEIRNAGNNFIVNETHDRAVYPMLNSGVEIANENASGNVFVFGVYYHQSFTNQTLIGVRTNSSQTQDHFKLGYRGTYIGVGLSYLFNLKNFKKEEVFFY